MSDTSLPSPQDRLAALRDQVATRATSDGRTDSCYPGLRYYRFSDAIEYRKRQILAPGVVVVLQGRKTARLADRALSYGPLDGLVLGTATACHGTVVEASAAAPYLAIHLDLPPEALAKTFAALDDTPPPPASGAGTAYVAPVAADVLEAFARLLPATDSPLDRRVLAPVIVEEIVVRLLRSEAAAAIRHAAAITRSAATIQRSMQFIQAGYPRRLTVQMLADHVAMSPSHYAHRFRRVAGVSPLRYLRDVRLEAARTLLMAGGVRVGEVALRVGFESAAHFTREFKRRYERPPSAYVGGSAESDKESIVSDIPSPPVDR